MFKEIIESVFNSILSQLKNPRKGAAMIVFIISSIIIFFDVKFLHHPVSLEGSFLHQLLYGAWIFSLMSIPIKAYNEYCDKKDAEKAEKERIKQIEEQEEIEKEKARKQINSYLEAFDLCDYEEQKVLVSFYYLQCTSVRVEKVAVIRAMKHKGIDFLNFEGCFSEPGKALTSTTGLKIINKYFDKQKPAFFELLNSLKENEIKLLKEFNKNNDKQIGLYKKENKLAKNIINKFKKNNYYDIYIDADGFLTISTLYLAYLNKYFSEGHQKIKK